MARSDKKKCQTLINIVAEQVTLLKQASDKLQRCQAAYQDQNVDPTGTPLEGNVQAIAAWISEVESVANNAVANGFLANVVPTHRNEALGEI